VLKLLLVDDEPDFILDILQSHGCDVDVAHDGLQALNMLSACNYYYDAMVLDIIMPKMDGWAVLKAVRNDIQLSKLPIIMLTSEKEDHSVIAGLGRGADIYLSKPLKPQILCAHLDALIRRSEWQNRSGIETEKNNQLLSTLTTREKEVLDCLAQGYSNQEIAHKLFVSNATIKNHLIKIYRKLSVSNRTQASHIYKSNN